MLECSVDEVMDGQVRLSRHTAPRSGGAKTVVPTMLGDGEVWP